MYPLYWVCKNPLIIIPLIKMHGAASNGKELVDHAFSNQALNTLVTYGSRGLIALETPFILILSQIPD